MTAMELVAHIGERNLPANTEVRCAPLDVDPDDLALSAGDLVLWYNEEGAIDAVTVQP